MTFREIKSFREVILFELQRRANDRASEKHLTFSEIWKLCEIAESGLRLPSNRSFVANIMSAISLLESDRLIVKHMKDDRISKLEASKKGLEMLKKTIFTHQERMGRTA